jgi:hypothetical protein
MVSRFTTRIVELSTEESANVLAYLTRHISENHDLQVRYRWGANDVAIWDNRCALHTATYVARHFNRFPAHTSIGTTMDRRQEKGIEWWGSVRNRSLILGRYPGGPALLRSKVTDQICIFIWDFYYAAGSSGIIERSPSTYLPICVTRIAVKLSIHT